MVVRDLASPRTLVSANSIISDISGRVPTSFFNNAMASRSWRFCRSKVRYAERMERIWLVAKPFLYKPTLLIPRITDGCPSAIQNGRTSLVTLFIPPINANRPIRTNCTTPVMPLMIA